MDGNFFASPVRYGDAGFLVFREGKVLREKAYRKGLEHLGKLTLNEVTHNTPAFSPGGLF